MSGAPEDARVPTARRASRSSSRSSLRAGQSTESHEGDQGGNRSGSRRQLHLDEAPTTDGAVLDMGDMELEGFGSPRSVAKQKAERARRESMDRSPSSSRRSSIDRTSSSPGSPTDAAAAASAAAAAAAAVAAATGETMTSVLGTLQEFEERGSSSLYRRALDKKRLARWKGFASKVKQHNDDAKADLDALSYACYAGQMDFVRELVESGALTDHVAKQCDNQRAIHFAAARGSREAVDILLRHGARANQVTESGVTPLLLAAANGAKGVVEALVNKGASPHLCDKRGNSPLHVAASNDSADAVLELIEAGASVHVLNDQDFTALHCAARGGASTAVVDALLDAGSEVDAANGAGDTGLVLAIGGGFAHIVQALLDGGADVASHRTGESLLHLATSKKRPHAAVIVRSLLEHGADVTATRNDGSTPLHDAALVGDPQVVRVLLEGSANAHARNQANHTALSLAVSNGHEEVVARLLLHGAAVDFALADSCGLKGAIGKRSYTVVQMLLDHIAQNHDPWSANGNSTVDIHGLDPGIDSPDTPIQLILSRCPPSVANHPILVVAAKRLWQDFGRRDALRRTALYVLLLLVYTVAMLLGASVPHNQEHGAHNYDGMSAGQVVRALVEVLTTVTMGVVLVRNVKLQRSDEPTMVTKHSWRDPWSLIDVVTVFFFIVAVLGRVAAVGVSPDGDDVLTRVDRSLTAVAVFFVWAHLFRYLLEFRVIGQFVFALRFIVGYLATFLLVMSILFVAFGAVFFLCFADTTPAFSTFPSAIVWLFLEWIGASDASDYYHLAEENAVMAPLLYVVFRTLTTVVLLNLVVAVIVSALQEIKTVSNPLWFQRWAKMLLYRDMQRDVGTRNSLRSAPAVVKRVHFDEYYGAELDELRKRNVLLLQRAAVESSVSDASRSLYLKTEAHHTKRHARVVRYLKHLHRRMKGEGSGGSARRVPHASERHTPRRHGSTRSVHSTRSSHSVRSHHSTHSRSGRD